MGNLQVFQSKTKKRRIATYLTKCSSEKPEAISSYVEKYGVNVKGAANDSPLSFAAQAVRLALYKKTSILNIEALINIEANARLLLCHCVSTYRQNWTQGTPPTSFWDKFFYFFRFLVATNSRYCAHFPAGKCRNGEFPFI
jgi:hypothetical protein